MPRSRPWLAALSVMALLFSLDRRAAAGRCAGSGAGRAPRLGPVHRADRVATADAIYAAFMEQNPNITITREAFSTDQMRETVNTAIASGTGPDIIFYDAGPGYAGVLADAGLLFPLDDYAAQYGWTERVAAPALEATTIDGTLYGMPLHDRPDRHVLQQDAPRSGRDDGSRDASTSSSPSAARPPRRATSRSPSAITRGGRRSTSSR